MIANYAVATRVQPHLRAADVAVTPILSLSSAALALWIVSLVTGNAVLGVVATLSTLVATAYFVIPPATRNVASQEHAEVS